MMSRRGYCATPLPRVAEPGAAHPITTVSCFSREKARPGAPDTRQQVDEVVVAHGAHQLLVQRACVSNGATTRCRWRAGPKESFVDASGVDGKGSPPKLLDLSRLAHAGNADDALTLEGLPVFGAFRIREPSGQSWVFAEDSGREMQGPLLEGHRPGPHVLGRLAVFVALAGALASLLAAARMERHLLRERGGVGVRTRSIAVYRDVELVADANRAALSPEERAANARRIVRRYRTILVTLVALTVVPVAIAWCRTPTPLPPLPLAQLEPPMA